MTEYLIQDSTLTSIGNEIRTLRGSSSKMTPTTMTSNLKSANTTVNNQTTIINQILAALETKGDGGLNFKIVGGTTQPSNPVENTIWVNTSTTITSWEFSTTQPVGSSGRVWICIGVSSPVEFNMVKQNSAKMYPIYAKQYINGAWVDVTAKSYQYGAWVDWWVWKGELYDNGDQIVNITGGWEVNPTIRIDTYSQYNNTNNVTFNANTMYLKNVGSFTTSCVNTVNKINITNYSKLNFTIKTDATNSNLFGLISTLGVLTGNSAASAVNTVNTGTGTRDLTIDISSLTGDYYIYGSTSSRNCTIYKVWLE